MSARLLALTLVVSSLVGLAALGTAEPPQVKIQAAVFWSTPEERDALRAVPGLDIMKVKPGHSFIIVTDQEQLLEIEALGFQTQVMIEDMAAFYASRRRGNNFGDFHTYSESTAYLDSIHTEHPDITTEKVSLGQTHEGREIWAIKVSDNPDLQEDEPEVLLDGLHHAREPITVEVMLDFLRYLCDSYGTDPLATFLVEERQIWIVPIMNPDGFCYNESTYPSGGGMWRKNRRDNSGSSCYGVDTNRNYPFEWGGVGSSSDPCDYLYRGPSAGSEPEVQALMDFMNAHEFVTHNSYHSVAAVVLIPWGYTNDPTPDDALLRGMAERMASYAGYQYGQPGDVLYNCSGLTLDWSYGEQVSKPKVFAFTTEVGGSGFWPADEEIPGLCAENLPSNIYLAQTAGAYLEVADYTIADAKGDGHLDPGESAEITVTFENLGITEGLSDVDVILRCQDPYAGLADAFSTYGAFGTQEAKDNASDPFELAVDAGCPEGHTTTLCLDVYAAGSLFSRVLLTLTIGQPQVVFFDDFESGTGNWSFSDGGWGIVTTLYHSPTHSITDSPPGNYSNDENTYMYLTNGLDLSWCTDADLTFWHRYEIEEGYDFAHAEASVDGGAYTQLGAKFTGNQTSWAAETRSLRDCCGHSDVKVRFRLWSDTFVTDDGWTIDDIAVTAAGLENTPPSEPVLASPAEGETVDTAFPTLVVANAADPDSATSLTYGFEVYGDSLLTTLVTSAAGIAEETDSTRWTADTPLDDGTYWWRAWADDGTERGLCPEPQSFAVEAGTEVAASGGSATPRRAWLDARPNPFSDGTLVGFSLPSRSRVQVSVFDVEGRLVRELVGATFDAGTHHTWWDGRDRAGRPAAGGVYFCLVKAEGWRRAVKLMLVR